MSDAPSKEVPLFLAASGEMPAMIAAHDWSGSLGPVANWPQSLKAIVGFLLRSPVPMVLLWGSHGYMIYNDAYSIFAGGRHPELLGKKVREGWPEVADFNDNVMDVGLAGGTLAYKDQELTLHRTGKPEQVWMNLDYSPVIDESGRPGGVIAIVVETTERILAERRQAHAAQRQRRQFEQAPGFIIVMNGPEHVVEFVNDTHRRVFGSDNWVGKTIREAFPSLDGQGFFELLDRVYETGENYEAQNAEIRYRRSADEPEEIRYLTFIYASITDENGEIVGIFCDGFDVTQAHLAQVALRNSEAALRESEAQFRTFAQAMANQVWAATPEGQLDWFNERTLEFSGLGFDDLVSDKWTTIVHPSDVQAAGMAWARAVSTGETYETEFRLRRADGVYRWHIARAVSLRDESGAITGWIGTNTDIHEQKVSAAALLELNATLERKIIERTQARGQTWRVTPDLMGALNSKGYFETSNPAWQTILGWSEEEVASFSIFELLHPDDVERTREGFNLTQIGQPAIRFPNRYRCKDGSYRWISWVGVPEEGMVYCVGRDITEEVAAQDKLMEAQEALRQSQKMEAVGQLTGGIAHDFNNLLQGISGSLDRVQHRIAQGRLGDVDRFVKAAIESANRAAALTHRLLAFSRRQTLDPRPVDMNTVITGMEDLIRRTMGPTVTIEVVGAVGLWPTKIDASQLENSLLNLCINARDAMPEGGHLTIETANKWMDVRAARDRDLPSGQYVSLCVTDTGTGMEQDVIDRAFDPFYTTKPIGQGTGLGLSMIYGFVRQSGGQVRVYSEVGKGTTMCLYFPRYIGLLEEELAAEEAPISETGSGEVILIVDDETTVRMLIVEVLTEAGYKTLEAPDGPAALRTLQSGVRVDLLITDVGLPGGMNGRQVADAGRVLRKDMKVLFITGFAENAAVGSGYLDHGMEILAKPFAMTALSTKVSEMLER
jgi:PAS domain S-box-containing protein